MSFNGGIKVSWNVETVRVEHVEAKLLVTRYVGKEWFSDRVSAAALAREKQRVEGLAVKALQALYEHKYRVRGTRRK